MQPAPPCGYIGILAPSSPFHPLVPCRKELGHLRADPLQALHQLHYSSSQTLSEPGSDLSVSAQSLQACLTLCDPMDCSPPGSSVHGLLQARILEWVAVPSSRGASDPGIEPGSTASSALQAGSLPLSL